MSNKKNGMLIGLGAVARAGKDTFANFLTEIVQDEGYKVKRFAFADALKAELEPYLNSLNMSAYETDSAKKAKVRPILVKHGRQRRLETNGRYWIDKIDKSVQNALKEGYIVIITDVRYNTNNNDELGWVHSLGGKVIYVERIDKNGEVVPPANEEEKENDPLLRKNVDIKVSMPTVKNNLDELRPIVYHTWSLIKQNEKI